MSFNTLPNHKIPKAKDAVTDLNLNPPISHILERGPSHLSCLFYLLDSTEETDSVLSVLLEVTAKISQPQAWGPSDPITSQASLGKFFRFSVFSHMSVVDDISEQFGANIPGTKKVKEELQMGSFCFHFSLRKLITTWSFPSRSLGVWTRFPFFKIYLFIYLFLAALGLRCCARAFSSCSKRGLLFVAVRKFLIAVASLVAGHRL